MPNTKSAKKELRKSARRREYNLRIKSHFRKAIKRTLKAIQAKDVKSAQEWLAKALKAIDKAAQKGVIKKNTRDRKKSRLHTKFNKAFTQS